ncbi:MAG: 50S ribosomal protein L6 [Planctomycetaceae bacterium]|jgi:large subunit ribosomal protein L6|nr:50S ribosomal protein L6 [Planctomycetaceae bacterium]
MSRIGKKPIVVPKGVKVTLAGQLLTVEGSLGKLQQDFSPNVIVKFDSAAGVITVERANDTRLAAAMHGLYRALFQNMVTGVTTGYEKKLEIFGTGYLFALSGSTLQVRAGFAHEVHKKVPEGLAVKCLDQTHVSIKGIDKQLVGQFAAEVRSIRKAEPYLGKGIKYEGEVIRRKESKAAAKK